MVASVYCGARGYFACSRVAISPFSGLGSFLADYATYNRCRALQYSPLSPDGKLIAYSSDRGLAGERDLYMEQVAGGQPIRLTFDGKATPVRIRQTAAIVFHSNRDGRGIYEFPAFGGEARLLAREGLNPRFSPEARKLLIG